MRSITFFVRWPFYYFTSPNGDFKKTCTRRTGRKGGVTTEAHGEAAKRGDQQGWDIPSIQHNFLYPTGLQSSSSCDFNSNSLEMQINSLRKFYQFHLIIFTQFCWDLKRSTYCNWIISLLREEFDEEYRSKQEEYEEELREWKKEAKRRVHVVSLLPTLATDCQRPGQTRATFQLDILRYISLATCSTSLASL